MLKRAGRAWKRLIPVFCYLHEFFFYLIFKKEVNKPINELKSYDENKQNNNSNSSIS